MAPGYNDNMKRTHRFEGEQMWLKSSRFPGSEHRDLEAFIYPRKKRYHGHSRVRVIFLLYCLKDFCSCFK